jgi:hypothetical protein
LYREAAIVATAALLRLCSAWVEWRLQPGFICRMTDHGGNNRKSSSVWRMRALRVGDRNRNGTENPAKTW